MIFLSTPFGNDLMERIAQEREVGSVRVVPYEPNHLEQFRALNLEWITKYFALEEADHKALDDPEGYILNRGGFIFMAECDGAIVGTCALIKNPDDSFELAKMAVTESAQGRGIGYLLGAAVVAKAKELGVRRVELLTNSRLAPALRLYQKLGFVEVPLPKTEYQRADVKMVLELSEESSAPLLA